MRKPIISISSKEIADLPPDSFDFGQVPITIVPEIITLPSTTTIEVLKIENPINLQTINNLQSINVDQKNDNIELKNLENNKIPVPSPSIIQPEIIRPETIESTTQLLPLFNINTSTNLPIELIKNTEKINTINSTINNDISNHIQSNAETSETTPILTVYYNKKS